MEVKITLTDADQEALKSLITQDTAGMKVVKKIIEFYVKELADIRNIDTKGNMGLQTLAMSKSVEKLERIFSDIFTGGILNAPAAKPKQTIGQYR